MPRFKKQYSARPRALQADFKILTKGERVQIRASYPKDQVEVLPQPAKWKTYRINQHWKIKFAESNMDTNLTMKGELIGLLVCTDGRKLRLTEKDFTVRDFGRLKTMLRSHFASKIEHDPRSTGTSV